MKSFSELTRKEKSTELLWWICVPAAAVLGVLALRIIAGFVMPPVLAQLSGSAAMPASDFRRFFLHSVSGILTAAVGHFLLRFQLPFAGIADNAAREMCPEPLVPEP